MHYPFTQMRRYQEGSPQGRFATGRFATKLEGLPHSPRARGVLFVLKGPYDPRVPPIVKFSQESESARLTKIILSKSTVKTL